MALGEAGRQAAAGSASKTREETLRRSSSRFFRASGAVIRCRRDNGIIIESNVRSSERTRVYRGRSYGREFFSLTGRAATSPRLLDSRSSRQVRDYGKTFKREVKRAE